MQKKIKIPKTRVDYEIRYRELNFSTVWRSIVWAAGCASRAWKRDGRDGARFLKFVYQGVYDSRGQHRPGTSFLPSSWWKRDRERGKKTAWQTELTPPRRANFVCHVGRQPRRKFDQPDAFWNETFLKTTLAIKVLIDLSPHIDAIVGFLEIPAKSVHSVLATLYCHVTVQVPPKSCLRTSFSPFWIINFQLFYTHIHTHKHTTHTQI